MIIRCPECAHTRQINDDKIPAGSTVATCPRCKTRFQFRTLPEEASGPAARASAPDSGRTAAGQDAGAGFPPTPESQGKSSAPKSAEPGRDEDDLWSAVEKFRGLDDDGDPDSGHRKKPQRFTEEDDYQDGPFQDRGPLNQGRGSDDFRREASGHEDFGRDDFSRRSGGEDPAQDPAQDAATDAGQVFLANQGSVPWEYKGGFLNPLGFFRTLVLSISRAADFFAGLPLAGSLAPALIFAVILRGLQFAASYMLFRFEAVTQEGETMYLSLAQATGIPMLHVVVVALVIIVLIQFASAFIVNFMVHLVHPGHSRFKRTFKVVAYSLSPLALVFIPQIGMLLGEIGSLALFVIGLRHAYQLTWSRTMMVVLPLVLLTSLLSASMIQTLAGGA